MSYCDKECQTIDWIYHKNECKVFRNKKFKPNEVKYYVKLLIRLWLTIKSNDTFLTKRHQLFDGSDISLKDIEINSEELLKDINRMNEFKHISKDLKDYSIQFIDKELLHWYGVIATSVTLQECISWSSYMGGPIDPIRVPAVGKGLYPQLFAVNHSCLPNSEMVFNGIKNFV